MNTHIFIVDSNTFKYHLEYMFAGTGSGNRIVDFNNVITSSLHHAGENSLVGMIADIQRIRIGDSIIFYLQQNSSCNIKEGKFFGIFKVKERVGFLDHNDENQFLKTELDKSLTFRVLIEPNNVYAVGVTEWEALDEINNMNSPNQMIWSLIYRKLKGNRGNTMITIYEADRLKYLIRNKNNRGCIEGQNLTFNIENQEIEVSDQENIYTGRTENINVLPRLINKYDNDLQFEAHLQAYVVQNIENLPMFQGCNIEWMGNEVSCGVGMQRIDIMLSIDDINKKVIPIELKSVVAYPDIVHQLQRYVDWIEQYYIPNRPSDIEPMIISREIIDKTSQNYTELISAIRVFNERNNILTLRFVEFTINQDDNTINFNEISY